MARAPPLLPWESLLLSAGMTVLSSISPHVKRFNERIRINGEEALDLDICSAFQSIDEARLLDREIPLTYFEYSALASLYLAKMKQVNVAIFEIGLGASRCFQRNRCSHRSNHLDRI